MVSLFKNKDIRKELNEIKFKLKIQILKLLSKLKLIKNTGIEDFDIDKFRHEILMAMCADEVLKQMKQKGVLDEKFKLKNNTNHILIDAFSQMEKMNFMIFIHGLKEMSRALGEIGNEDAIGIYDYIEMIKYCHFKDDNNHN